MNGKNKQRGSLKKIIRKIILLFRIRKRQMKFIEYDMRKKDEQKLTLTRHIKREN